MDDVGDHYEVLFAPLRNEYGTFDPDTLTSIVGFAAGGPVSLFQNTARSLFATCELSLYPDQCTSVEGLRYEFFAVGLNASASRDLFTALGNLSFNATLGDGHTIDVSQVVEPHVASQVQLRLYSQCSLAEGRFGVFQVVPMRPGI